VASALRLPLRLRLLIPAVENAIAGNAFRPQDILTSRKGLTVEIWQCDANEVYLHSRDSNQKKKQTTQQEKITQQKQVAIHEPEQNLPIVEKEPIKIESVEVTQVVTKTEKPIVIEFTLDPIPSTKTAIAATEEKPALKKILDKALDIKNGDAELGGLRMAKNELFALDFKKDKSKRN